MSEDPADEVRNATNDERSETAGAKRLFAGKADLLISAGLILGIVVLFAKTIFAGAPISKVHVIAEWDSMFKNFSSGQSQLMDPSLILLMVPYYLMVGRSWQGFELPLWNSASGFGAPLLADPQSLALSILHLPMAISPTIATYNLVLLMELMILAVGGYVLGKTAGLPRITSIFLAATLLLCPYHQWYLELLGNGYCLIPFLLAAFLRVAKVRTFSAAAIAGLTAAVVVLSAHPELSFCSILFASLLMMVMLPMSDWRKSIALLCTAGGIAFCLAAPMLLPFVEYLAFSDSYKFGNRAPAFYPWQTLAFNLIQPGYGGASPFLGVLALLSLPFAFATIYDAIRRRSLGPWSSRIAVSVGALSLAAWAISAKIYPLGLLLTRRPFSYVVVTYTFPVLIVLVATLAALGLERLLSLSGSAAEKRYQHHQSEWILLAVPLAAIALFPLIVQLLHIDLRVANFDMTLPAMELSNRDWVRNVIVALVAVASLGLARFLSGRGASTRMTMALACICLAAGVFSQLTIQKKSMPIRPSFTYPETETISFLKKAGNHRMIATGEHTLRPNTNLAYGLRDARFHNPIFPERYLTFMERAGASLDEFNQVFGTEPSRMIDIASVRHIVTPDALFERAVFENVDQQVVELVQPLKWTNDSSPVLNEFRTAVDAAGRAVCIETTWDEATVPKKFAYSLTLADGAGAAFWISDRKVISLPGEPDRTAGPIRNSIKPGGEIGVRISVFDASSGKLIVPSRQDRFPTDHTSLLIAKLEMPAIVGKVGLQRRFNLLAETREGMRVYANAGAVPDAYVVCDPVYVTSGEQALDEISKSTFDGVAKVVIEGSGSSAKSSKSGTGKATVRRHPQKVSISAQSDSPGFLVLTDIFYPGWKATIDRAPVEILRANYAFRAIPLPAGEHSVEFHYQPYAFYVGAVLSAIGLAVTVLLLVKRRAQ